MRLQVVGVAAAFVRAAAAQEVYTDAEGRTFAGYSSAGVTYGIAIPESASEGESYDAIVQITAPIAMGWVGLAWGGSMTYNPLTIVWPNGEDVMISSRIAFGYSVPPTYADAILTLLAGSGVNDTHYRATALCQGCTYWAPFGSAPTALNHSGENVLAFAYSGIAVDNPQNEDTTFGIHERTGSWIHDFSLAQQAGFEEWAEDGDDAEEPSVTEPYPPPTSTSAVESPTFITATVTNTDLPLTDDP